MTFSKAQLLFAAIFFVFFAIAMVYAYRKDAAVWKKHYQGVYKVFLIIFGVFAAYFILVRLLK